jgi:hypothetical protein
LEYVFVACNTQRLSEHEEINAKQKAIYEVLMEVIKGEIRHTSERLPGFPKNQ